MGAGPLVSWENDKPTVVALREIAEGKLDPTLRTRDSKATSTALEVGEDADTEDD
jgi:DNA-directed RNA polymerase subunit omega